MFNDFGNDLHKRVRISYLPRRYLMEKRIGCRTYQCIKLYGGERDIGFNIDDFGHRRRDGFICGRRGGGCGRGGWQGRCESSSHRCSSHFLDWTEDKGLRITTLARSKIDKLLINNSKQRGD
jgi:hypothetical protein